jgi:hypothetical protein
MLQLFDEMRRSYERPNGVETEPTDGVWDRHNRLLRAVGDAVRHLQNFACQPMVSADHLGEIHGVGLRTHMVQDLLTGRLQDGKTAAGFVQERSEFLMEARAD